MRQATLSTLRPYRAISLIWLALNLPLLLGKRVIPWDAMDEFYATVYYNAHSLRHGIAPWWNPYLYSGYPQIADPQGMMFSPLLMGWMMLPADPGVTWFTWGVLLHLLMGAAAMVALLLRKAATAFGAVVGATVFMAGGVAAARLEHTPIVLAYAYVPVVLLTLQRLVEAPGWRRSVIAGLAAGALATQLVQATYLFALMGIGYAVGATVRRWPGYSVAQRWQGVVGLGFATLLAAAMALPQVLFTWAFLGLSNRPVLPLAAAAPASVSLKAFATFLDPNAFHALRGTYDGSASRVEAYFYLGAIPTLLLAGLGGAWGQPRQRNMVIFFGAAALLAAFYMLGVNTPVYGWLYHWLPGVRQFRRPSDAAYLVNLSLSILVGLSAGHVRLESRRYCVGLLAVVTGWLALASLHMRDEGVRWQAATLLGAIVAGVALWRITRAPDNRHAAFWLLLVLVADYRCFNLNGSFNEGRDNARSFLHSGATQFVLAQLTHAPAGLKPRVENLDVGTVWDDLVAVAAVPSTQGYNPLRYALYDHWYGARESGAQPRVGTPFNRSPGSKLTDLLGVAYLIKRPDRSGAWLAPSGYARAFTDGRTEVWRNEHAYSRALTPVRAQLPIDGAAPTPGQFETTDFRNVLWLTPRDPVDKDLAAAAMARCSTRLAVDHLRETPTRVVMDTRAPAPGWLVLGDLDFPGWEADVDGRAVPIHRANGMFRAVCVPGGDHTVRFSFHPWAMVAQAWRERPRG